MTTYLIELHRDEWRVVAVYDSGARAIVGRHRAQYRAVQHRDALTADPPGE